MDSDFCWKLGISDKLNIVTICFRYDNVPDECPWCETVEASVERSDQCCEASQLRYGYIMVRGTMLTGNIVGGDYVHVNPPKPGVPSWGELTDNAAHSLFITEIGRGMAVTLGHIFKEPATINYPFEKGPLSPR